MLKVMGAMAAGAALAACGAPAAPTEEVKAPEPAATEAPAAAEEPAEPEATEPAAPEAPAEPAQAAVDIGYMMDPGELSDDQVSQFNTDYAPIVLARVDRDETRFWAMLAAGTPPDCFRIQAPSIPQLIGRNIIRDLTPYFQTSATLKPDDLAPGNYYYFAEDPFHIGKGKIYGMVKDFSEDYSQYVNKTLLDELGVAVPSTTEPMDYDQLAQFAKDSTVVEGGANKVTGWLFESGWAVRTWMLRLMAMDQSLYSEDFSTINIVENEEAVKAIQWHFDLQKEKYANSPINPLQAWCGPDFLARLGASVQYGFWFSGFVLNNRPPEHPDDEILHIPAPIYNGKRMSPTHAATGSCMTQATKNPDQAWAAFEWYNGKEPAIDRAKSGWGIPGLKSFYEMIPEETPAQKQFKEVMLDELKYADSVLQYNPYLLQSEPQPESAAYAKYSEPVLNGQGTFEEMLQSMEDEVNAAIKDGMDRMGA
jgi:multiple sugar transport system substrate-binding protein